MVQLKEQIYQACLNAAKSMTPEELKSMSWFGGNSGQVVR